MIQIYTDGACSPNPGRGGWAFVLVHNNQFRGFASGKKAHTTNNRMEYTAVLEALRFWLSTGNTEQLIIYSDSQLLTDTYNSWMNKWALKGWVRKAKGGKRSEIKNLDLVLALYDMKRIAPHIKVEWIRGHNGNHWNELADKICVAEASGKPYKSLARLRYDVFWEPEVRTTPPVAQTQTSLFDDNFAQTYKQMFGGL